MNLPIPKQFKVSTSHSSNIKRVRVHVGNNYALSVMQGEGTYGAEAGLYECAVMHKEQLTYDTPIAGDVIGHCTEEEVMQLIAELHAFASSTETIQFKDE